MKNRITNRIQDELNKQGMTQEQLTDKLNTLCGRVAGQGPIFRPNQICTYCNNHRTPTVEVFGYIATVLDVKIDDLIVRD